VSFYQVEGIPGLRIAVYGHTSGGEAEIFARLDAARLFTLAPSLSARRKEREFAAALTAMCI
jgi:hypothetical protein